MRVLTLDGGVDGAIGGCRRRARHREAGEQGALPQKQRQCGDRIAAVLIVLTANHQRPASRQPAARLGGRLAQSRGTGSAQHVDQRFRQRITKQTALKAADWRMPSSLEAACSAPTQRLSRVGVAVAVAKYREGHPAVHDVLQALPASQDAAVREDEWQPMTQRRQRVPSAHEVGKEGWSFLKRHTCTVVQHRICLQCGTRSSAPASSYE